MFTPLVLPPLLTMMRELVAIPSVSSSHHHLDMSNLNIVNLLASWAEPLGFRCEILPVSPGKYNLLATCGQGHGGLLLSGHTDTVPYDAQGWISDPFKLIQHADKLVGLGIADMKCFFAMALHAVVKFKPEQFRAPLMLLATCDEESSMRGAQALRQDQFLGIAQAVIGEPTGLKPVRMHKGILMCRLRVQGQSGHSSNPDLGHNALEAMHHMIQSLLDYRTIIQQRYQQPLFSVPYPTMNLGCIHGGDNPNRICAECELQFDLRPLPGMDTADLFQTLQTQITHIAERHQVQATLEPLFSGTPPFSCRSDAAIIQACVNLTGAEARAVSYATEAPYLSALGLDTVILGAGDIDCAHQPNEYLDLDRITPMTRILEQLINHFCLHSTQVLSP
ncbi:MAG: acetylornithine deacetylase [Pseudomonadales bacterium]|nr:acetylornithine deacetylase [Pseudomonadales bacterium]